MANKTKGDLLYVDLLYEYVLLLYLEESLMNIIKVFSRNLKKYRIEKGLSQEELGHRTGLHRTYISALECQKVV